MEQLVARVRALPRVQHPAISQRRAAVLVGLFAHPTTGEPCVLLTQRSHKLTSHQGEVCLPGGKRDPTDADDTTCALREAHEELGLRGGDVEVLACLPPVLSKHLLSVAPIVARVPPTRAAHAPTPSPSEVAAVFEAPLALFVDGSPACHAWEDISWGEYTYRIHSFEHCGFTIWGLTAAILIQVAQLALGRRPAFEEHAPPSSSTISVTYGSLCYDGQRLRVQVQPHAAAGAKGGRGADAEDDVCCDS